MATTSTVEFPPFPGGGGADTGGVETGGGDGGGGGVGTADSL